MGLVDSAILGHDTGLGKTWAGFTYALLKCGWTLDGHRIQPKGPVLIVAPGDLHDQWIKEGADHFRAHVRSLDCQETFLSLSTLDPKGRRVLPPGFYIVSYTALGHNGVRALPKPDQLKTLEALKAALASFTDRRWDQLTASYRPQAEGAPATFAELTRPNHVLYAQRYLAGRLETVGLNVGSWNFEEDVIPGGIREVARPVRCVWDPTLADLCADAFDCVVVDEATKLKGGFDTQIAAGVLQLQPRYRLVCTATPIKNRLQNIFPLAWWACGGKLEATARWPYPLHEAGRFAKTFHTVERNLTKERAERGAADPRKRRSRFCRLTPQVCNVHKVWKLLAPVVLRRRKKDIGEDIVGKSRQVYRVPMGTMQAQVYKAHLEWNPVDANGRSTIGPKLQALRMAAAAPHSPLLPKMRGPAYCPKMAATMTLIEQVLRQGKQVIVFSPFHDPLDEIARRLRDAFVSVEVLDGRMSQAKRGAAALRFKKRLFPVLLASNECMAEGHSFPNCSFVIQYAYPWALDKVLQSEDRAHRINSVEDLQVYRLITEGSIDPKMESQIDEKADAAELVLDGHLLGERPEEVNLAELLQVAAREFDEKSKTIDESTLESEWPALRERLKEAAREWTLGTSEIRTPKPTAQAPAAPVLTPLNWREVWRARKAAQAALIPAA